MTSHLFLLHVRDISCQVVELWHAVHRPCSRLIAHQHHLPPERRLPLPLAGGSRCISLLCAPPTFSR
eukprot:5111227-Amphidinium_carterae.1